MLKKILLLLALFSVSDVLIGAITGVGSDYLCYKGQQWLNKKRKK